MDANYKQEGLNRQESRKVIRVDFTVFVGRVDLLVRERSTSEQIHSPTGLLIFRFMQQGE